MSSILANKDCCNKGPNVEIEEARIDYFNITTYCFEQNECHHY